jgi:hypothetical protein
MSYTSLAVNRVDGGRVWNQLAALGMNAVVT